MNREQYLQQRAELMNRAQAHIDAGEFSGGTPGLF